MKKILIILTVLIFMPFAFAEDPFEIENKYGAFPQINITQNVYPYPTDLLSSIQPIRINDPYAAAGQPVIIEFTLTNIGDELGYPFNSIPLTPNNYSLVMMVDNEYDSVLLPNGKTIDVWGQMNEWEKFGFALGTSVSAFGDWVSVQLEGRSCGYVNIWTQLPEHIQNYITIQNDGKKPKAIYIWSCIKIVDEVFFAEKINHVCEGKITAECITTVNERSYVGDSAVVVLSDDERGVCQRSAKKSGSFLDLLGASITNQANIIDCGIGPNGLKPRESVTFRFVGLIPSDAPVLPPEDFIREASIDSGFTESASCLSSEYPEACHTIYAGVFPTAKQNLVKVILDTTVGNLIKGGQMIIGTLYHMDLEVLHDVALVGGGITPRIVGKPIWEGRGIFFVVASALRGEITLILYLAAVAGLITTASVMRRTGG